MELWQMFSSTGIEWARHASNKGCYRKLLPKIYWSVSAGLGICSKF